MMLESFFNAKCVAVIGASEAPGKLGNSILRNLSDFTGTVYGVNPKGGEYLGVKFYPSVAELPETPEVVVIAIPEKFVIESMKECGEKGVKFAVIISAGFKEVGNVEAEEELKAVAKEYGIRILGPNCLGYINAYNNLNASFGGKAVSKGNVALVSQSGAMAVALMDWAISAKVGFSKIISMGNKSDLDEANFLEYLEHDDESEVIVFYLESLNAGRKFFDIARRVTKKKPIVLVKSGNSARGSAAIASHTGALAGEKEILHTAFKQAGIHYTDALKKVFLWSETFSHTIGKEIAEEMIIITNAGGPGVMATDNAERFGVQLANFSEEEKAILKEGLSPAASVNNPIDIIGDATSKEYAQILSNISKLKKNYTTLVMLTPQAVTDVENIAKVINDYCKQNPEKLVLTSFMGGVSVLEGRKYLQEQGVPHFEYPRDAISSFAELIRQKKWESTPPSASPNLTVISESDLAGFRETLANTQGLVSPEVSNTIMDAFGVNYAKEYVVTSAEDAASVFEKLGQKGVMKIVSPDIAHKSDCGGVLLNIDSAEKAQEAYQAILNNVQKVYPNAKIEGVSVQPMLSSSRETFLGFKRDPSFKEVILFGLGGIFVNIFEDVSMRIAPVSGDEIDEMMKQIIAYPILAGARGEKSIDFDALKETILKIQSIFVQIPEIKEIDVNPIFTREDGAWVIDIKLYC